MLHKNERYDAIYTNRQSRQETGEKKMNNFTRLWQAYQEKYSRNKDTRTYWQKTYCKFEAYDTSGNLIFSRIYTYQWIQEFNRENNPLVTLTIITDIHLTQPPPLTEYTLTPEENATLIAVLQAERTNQYLHLLTTISEDHTFHLLVAYFDAQKASDIARDRSTGQGDYAYQLHDETQDARVVTRAIIHMLEDSSSDSRHRVYQHTITLYPHALVEFGTEDKQQTNLELSYKS